MFYVCNIWYQMCVINAFSNQTFYLGESIMSINLGDQNKC